MCTILLTSINNLFIFFFINNNCQKDFNFNEESFLDLFIFIHLFIFSCSCYRKDFSVINFASDQRIKKYSDFEWKCCLFFGCS